MKRKLVTVTAILLSLCMVGCGSSSSSKDIDSMSDQELEEYMEEVAEGLEDLDENELEELFEEASGDSDNDESEDEEAATITSLSQLTDGEWESIAKCANKVIKEDIGHSWTDVYMSDGGGAALNGGDYKNYMDNLRAAEACLTTRYYEYSCGGEFISQTLYLLCYIDMDNLSLYDIDGDWTDIEKIDLDDMVCVIQLRDSNALEHNSSGSVVGYNTSSKILFFCDTMDYAKEYISELNNGYESDTLKNTTIEFYDASFLDIHFPE